MCESHVSNPQTVGKCCSLLNSLLPPSLLPSLALSFCWNALQASALPRCNPVRVCVHASVCARACLPRSTQEVSTERLPAELRLELPLPADSFYANTKFSTTHIHTHTNSHGQPPQLPVRNNQDAPRWREAARSLSFSVCLSLYPVGLFLLNTNTDIFSLCVHCLYCFEDPELRLHAEFFSDACQQAR